MATFRAGQRVRIKFCYHAHLWGDHAGRQCTLIREHHDPMLGDGWEADIDFVGPFREAGIPHWFGPEQLEPIRYDGNRVVSWESMRDLWQPSHIAKPREAAALATMVAWSPPRGIV